jgi:hypothetical protein
MHSVDVARDGRVVGWWSMSPKMASTDSYDDGDRDIWSLRDTMHVDVDVLDGEELATGVVDEGRRCKR